MRVCGRRGFGRAGGSRTRRSPRCPNRSAACPSSAICASAGHSARVGAARACPVHVGFRRGCGWMRCGTRSDACVRTLWVWPCRWITNTPIAALPESFTSLSNLGDLCVRRGTCAHGCGTCAPVHVGVRRAVAGCGAARDLTRVSCRGFGRAGRSRTRRSPRCPNRSPACPISAICASAGQLRALGAVLARPVLVGVGRAVAGCRAARGLTRVSCGGFGRAGRSRTRRSPRCPSRSPACPSSAGCASAGQLRAWLRHVRAQCTFELAGAVAGCGAARHRMCVFHVEGSAVQDDH